MILRPTAEELQEERAYLLDAYPELRAEHDGTLREYRRERRLAALRLSQISYLLRED